MKSRAFLATEAVRIFWQNVQNWPTAVTATLAVSSLALQCERVFGHVSMWVQTRELYKIGSLCTMADLGINTSHARN